MPALEACLGTSLELPAYSTQHFHCRRWRAVHRATHQHLTAYCTALTTLSTNGAPFGVPSPVTLSQPGPVVSDESVPNENTAHAVELLWNNALTKSFVFCKGSTSAAALSNVGA